MLMMIASFFAMVEFWPAKGLASIIHARDAPGDECQWHVRV